MDRKFDIIASIVSFIFLLILFGAIAFVFFASTNVNTHQHVHFLDTNECFDIKDSDVYKGVAIIWFDDNSEIKCSANNVIVYVNHPCDYCDWGH